MKLINNKLISIIKPFLIYVIIAIMYSLLFLYFADTFCCEDISLDELKQSLELAIDKYKDSQYSYEYWKNRIGQEEYYALVDSDEEEMADWIETCKERANNGLAKAKEDLSSVRTIEEHIKEKDSNFKSCLNKQNIED